jgi:dTDP-4-amino-4,6-dideoxygalactose transaminase
MKNIKFNDLGKQWSEIRDGAINDLDRIGSEGSYIGGNDISIFENKFSEYIGTKYGIGVSNGTDALKIALRAYDLNENDLIVIPANTFIADYFAVKHLSKSPRVMVVDHDDTYCISTFQINRLMSEFRKAYRKVVVIPVHLYGHSCDMDIIMNLSREWDFEVLEDCSQSHGTLWNGKKTGSFGSISIFSLYPGKNLGAIGDAGIICTNNDEYHSRMVSLRNYGAVSKYHYEDIGYNNRLDSIHAAFLSRKLELLDEWNDKKRIVARRYLDEIKGVGLPIIREECLHSFHIFCIRVENRSNFMDKLSRKGIPTLIHYPIPIHLEKTWEIFKDMVFSAKRTNEFKDKIVSIPIHPFLTEDEVSHIIKTINE